MGFYLSGRFGDLNPGGAFAQGEVSSVTTMEQWPAQLRQGAPPPPLPVYAPPTEADFYAAESDLF